MGAAPDHGRSGPGPLVAGSSMIPVQPGTAGYSRLMVGLLVFFSLLGLSPLWHVIGVQHRHLLVLTLLGVVTVSCVHRRPLTKWVVPLALVLFASAFAAGVYWAEPRLTLYPMFLVGACLLVGQSTRRELERYVDVASWIMLTLVIGAVVGFLLVRFGVAPLADFPNPDGRTNYVFFTTLTNAYWTRWIQPSGIYDEPGAFSFVICAIAFLRHVQGKDFRLTWLLLGLGLITFSLAHLVFIIVFALSQPITLRSVRYLTVAVALLVGAVHAVGVQQIYRDYLFARVTLDAAQQRGMITRVQLLRNAADGLRQVDGAIFFGIDSDCTVDYMACRRKWAYMGENPLGPLAHHGLLLAWPYYLFLAIAAVLALRGRRNFALLALALLFLQRPYVMSMSYSFLAVAALWFHFQAAGRAAELPAANPLHVPPDSELART
jgi:hypothetical protein